MEHQDMLESVSEELKLFMNFDTKIIDNKIVLDTVVGKYIYTISEKTIMGNVYRFISNYGLKLHKHFLDEKIKELEEVKQAINKKKLWKN